MEMYYVREYTPTCRFLKIINSGLVDYFQECTVGVYSPLNNSYINERRIMIHENMVLL